MKDVFLIQLLATIQKKLELISIDSIEAFAQSINIPPNNNQMQF